MLVPRNSAREIQRRFCGQTAPCMSDTNRLTHCYVVNNGRRQTLACGARGACARALLYKTAVYCSPNLKLLNTLPEARNTARHVGKRVWVELCGSTRVRFLGILCDRTNFIGKSIIFQADIVCLL